METEYKNGLLVPKNNPRIVGASGLGTEGWIECYVIDAKTKNVLRQYPKQRNLILNYGLNYWCSTSQVSSCWTNAVVGTGTTVTSVDSSPSTAAQSGTTVTISGGTFAFTSTVVDAGRMIKWDTGEEARVVTVTSASQAEVYPSQSVSAIDFTYYYTNQAGLTTESKRTNSYLTSTGACDATLVSNVSTSWRTFDFSAETGNVAYNEIGFSPTNTPAANLWSRIKLAAPISLIAGQQLRVKYTVATTISPSTPVTINPSVISGWPTATGSHCAYMAGISKVSTSGGTTPWRSFIAEMSWVPDYYLEPAENIVLCLSAWTPSPWPPTFGTTPGGTDTVLASASTALSTYTALDFYRDKTATWSVNNANFTNINCIQNLSGSWANWLDSPQTKDNTHTLSLTFRSSVSRVLA